jgi:2-polyprenyl-3-methyl-5-hydroxy-6-metoxy-1,4-benzoquinol methylase
MDRLRLLDIATGGGDIPIALWRRAQREGLELDILGLDVSERAVQYAAARADRARVRVDFAVANILADELPQGFDVVLCSLFLHHLADDQACHALRSMASVAQRMVVVSDLVRSRLNLALVRLGAGLVTRSDVVHADAMQSVRAAFRLDEARQLAHEAGLSGADLRPCFPCRFLLTWRPAP